MQPDKITLRTYQVGFGDCFLLTFHYSDQDRHILIDFGTTGLPAGFGKQADYLSSIAQNIKERCNGQLDAVIATHRHADHISGFASKDAPPGSIIASCKPKLVLQPWTEDPDLDDKDLPQKVAGGHGFREMLQNMHGFADLALKQKVLLGEYLAPAVRDEIGFVGEDNLPNLDAVKNLQIMAGDPKKNRYLSFGGDSGLEQLLPGVKVKVLGPPTLKQSDDIRQRTAKSDEFWNLQAGYWAFQTGAFKGGNAPFKGVAKEVPPFSQWLQRRMKEIQGEQVLELVRALDKAMNNTSLILLFVIGEKKLLFPGDAQIENWSWELAQDGAETLLSDVDFYKVGHHGSTNATPKKLWNWFHNNKPNVSASNRMTSVVSTMADKHGHEDSGTEVPRRPLVTALKAGTKYFTTQDIKSQQEFFVDVEL